MIPGLVSFAQTIDVQKGATLFGRACIGCHDGGGNIIQPVCFLTSDNYSYAAFRSSPTHIFFLQGATLFTNDLQRNGVDTEEEIFRVTYFGKGRMPGFGENCMPRGQCTFGPRLQAEEIKLLAEFVKLQADRGWSSIVSNGD
ncbi:Cytochrome c-like domain [Dillenia turbinata]|uniref:Cytochrome c-553 n=1 Tax=Dillenia turbinata TaxID=194707 RepID=A0AAN8ZFG7_9MAGN